MAAKKRYSPRKIGTMVDLTHIFIGLIILIMAGFAIFHPDKYMGLFPLIFFFASVLSFVTSWYMFVSSQRNSRKTVRGVVYLTIGLMLFGLFIVSAISIWGHN